MNTNYELESNRQIKVGAILAYITLGLEIISGLVYTPWMVNQIGIVDYGLFSLATSLITFFALDFGLGSAVTRFLSYYIAEGNKEAASKFLGITFKLYIAISAVLFLTLFILYFFIEGIYVQLGPSEIEKLKVIYVIFGMFTVISFPLIPLNGILISYERFVFTKVLSLSISILNITLMATSLLLGYGLYALVLVSSFVGLIRIAIQYLYVMKKTDTKVDFYCRDKTIFKNIFTFSLWSTIGVVAQRFVLNITPSILGALSGSIEIAVFSVALKIENYTFFLTNGLSGLFLPKVSRMINNSQNGMDQVEKLNLKIGRILLLIIGLIVIGFTSMGKEFMQIWMGKNFSDSYYVVLLLITPSFFTFPLQIANITLIATNKVKYIAFASSIIAIINMTLSLILSKYYGAIGAGLAIFLGSIVGKVFYLNIIYHKILKFNIYRFYKECYGIMLVPLGIALFSGFVIQYFLPVSSMLYFLIKGIIFCIIYFALIWIISLNEYEKDLLVRTINGVLKRNR